MKKPSHRRQITELHRILTDMLWKLVCSQLIRDLEKSKNFLQILTFSHFLEFKNFQILEIFRRKNLTKIIKLQIFKIQV